MLLINAIRCLKSINNLVNFEFISLNFNLNITEIASSQALKLKENKEIFYRIR